MPLARRIMKTFVTCIVCAIACSFPVLAHATSYAQPKLRDVYSPNRKYFVRIHPDTEKHDIFAVGDDTPLWSFTRHVWHDDYFVCNDGEFVAWVAWRHCKAEQVNDSAVIVYSRDGIAASHSYRDLCSPQRRLPWDVGPIGDFWRVWRKECQMAGDTITINTIGIGGKRIVLTREGLGSVDGSFTVALLAAFGATVVAIALALIYQRMKKANNSMQATPNGAPDG